MKTKMSTLWTFWLCVLPGTIVWSQVRYRGAPMGWAVIAGAATMCAYIGLFIWSGRSDRRRARASKAVSPAQKRAGTSKPTENVAHGALSSESGP